MDKAIWVWSTDMAVGEFFSAPAPQEMIYPRIWGGSQFFWDKPRWVLSWTAHPLHLGHEHGPLHHRIGTEIHPNGLTEGSANVGADIFLRSVRQHSPVSCWIVWSFWVEWWLPCNESCPQVATALQQIAQLSDFLFDSLTWFDKKKQSWNACSFQEGHQHLVAC